MEYSCQIVVLNLQEGGKKRQVSASLLTSTMVSKIWEAENLITDMAENCRTIVIAEPRTDSLFEKVYGLLLVLGLRCC